MLCGCGSWKKLQVGEDDEQDEEGERLFDHLGHGGRSRAAGQWVMEEKDWSGQCSGGILKKHQG